jgi:peptide/nickel transport system substrate-binding protein
MKSVRPVRVRGVLAALVLGATVVAACGGNSPSSSTEAGGTTASTDAPVLTNAPTTTNPALVPVQGGTLTVALADESPGFNPTVDPWGFGGHNVARAIYDTLATFDASGKVVPYLAESIEGNSDATVWTITLRDGVKFHDGTALDAEAVRMNFQAVKDSPQYSSQLALLSSMKVIDDRTIELTMSAPWGTFLNALTGSIGSQIGYIAAPATLTDPEGGRNPIGTGPFKFKEWVPDDHLTVVRNDDYWQDPAYLDEVIFKPIPDSDARKAAFDAADTDLYATGSSKEITEYQAAEKSGDVTVTIGTPSEPDLVMMNVRKAPLDDLRIRQALAGSVDIGRLYDFLEATGVKQPMHGPYADTSYWYVKSNYPDYDVEAAKALVAEYVAEKGSCEFEIAGNGTPWHVSYMELFQAMWDEIGCKVNITSRAQAENIDAVIGGNYQVILWGGIGGGDPDNDYNYFHSGGAMNFSGYSSPTIDAALEKGRALSDPEARKEQYAIVQKELGDVMPYIWTGTNQWGVVVRPNVLGLSDFDLPDGTPGQPITGGFYFLKDVWLQQ